MSRRRVLLLEINEITWDLIDPLIEDGKLPTFARMKKEGAWATPMSVDVRPQLDPWITWNTVYTGRPQADHNVFFLEQPPESIHAKRIWEILNERGLRVGVYGSICSWPPQTVHGYYIPDTFAQDFSTYPQNLSPIQQLNLTYTRSVRLKKEGEGLGFMAKLGWKLIGLGLRPSTMAKVTRQLAHERLHPEFRWKRVSLQPMVNFDFFSRLWKKHQPDFATFHTNHVAHYQHTYWKAMKPELFHPLETSAEEIRVYGGAIEYGYRSADDLLGAVVRLLAGTNTVLVVASSMGQAPYTSERYKKGKAINQVRSLEKLMEILGMAGKVRTLATMSDQFNVYADDPAVLAEAKKRLEAAYVDTPEHPMFEIDALEDSFVVSLERYDEVKADSRCFFPHREKDKEYRYEDLVYSTGLVKSGWHDPKGMMIIYGPGVRPGAVVHNCNNLDIAPTLYHLLGEPIPPELKGRVLTEVLTEPAMAMAG